MLCLTACAPELTRGARERCPSVGESSAASITTPSGATAYVESPEIRATHRDILMIGAPSFAFGALGGALTRVDGQRITTQFAGVRLGVDASGAPRQNSAVLVPLPAGVERMDTPRLFATGEAPEAQIAWRQGSLQPSDGLDRTVWVSTLRDTHWSQPSALIAEESFPAWGATKTSRVDQLSKSATVTVPMSMSRGDSVFVLSLAAENRIAVRTVAAPSHVYSSVVRNPDSASRLSLLFVTGTATASNVLHSVRSQDSGATWYGLRMVDTAQALPALSPLLLRANTSSLVAVWKEVNIADARHRIRVAFASEATAEWQVGPDLELRGSFTPFDAIVFGGRTLVLTSTDDDKLRGLRLLALDGAGWRTIWMDLGTGIVLGTPRLATLASGALLMVWSTQNSVDGTAEPPKTRIAVLAAACVARASSERLRVGNVHDVERHAQQRYALIGRVSPIE